MTPFPQGPLIDPQTGEPTQAMRAFMQAVHEAKGKQWDIRFERVDDTHVKVRMLGSDGTWRSNTLTLS